MKKYSVAVNEFSARRINMICDRPLARLPYAQAGVDVKPDGVALFSYSTCAAEIHGCALYVTCLCSNTTRRHVSAFVREYAPALTYADAKRAFLAGKPIDIRTGEIIEEAAAV